MKHAEVDCELTNLWVHADSLLFPVGNDVDKCSSRSFQTIMEKRKYL